MRSIARELQRQLAQREQRKAIPSKVYSKSTKTFQDFISHILDPNAHHPKNHAASHAPDGEDPLQLSTVVRYPFTNLTTIEITHNLGSYPMVQILQQVAGTGSGGSSESLYGRGIYGTGLYSEGVSESLYGAGNYGVGPYSAGGSAPSVAMIVITPTSITHNSKNKITVVLPEEATGEVLLIG